LINAIKHNEKMSKTVRQHYLNALLNVLEQCKQEALRNVPQLWDLHYVISCIPIGFNVHWYDVILVRMMMCHNVVDTVYDRWINIYYIKLLSTHERCIFSSPHRSTVQYFSFWVEMHTEGRLRSYFIHFSSADRLALSTYLLQLCSFF
jgi:hypothetical protein